MESQNNITEQMKEAARNAESKPFAGMENVWDKVAARLDAEEKPQPAVVPFINYKKITAAAAVLILMGLGTGYVLFNNKPQSIVAKNDVTIQQQSKKTATPETPEIAASQPDEKQNLNIVKDMKGSLKHVVASKNNGHKAVGHVIESKDDNSGVPAAQSSNGINAVPVVAEVQTTKSIDNNKETIIAKGKVIDGESRNSEGLPGAAVHVVGTNLNTITDVDGNFEIALPAGKKQISISSINYNTQTVIASESMAVNLKSSENVLTEVTIATPYGPPITKEGYVGAADVITGKMIENTPVSDISKAIGANNNSLGYSATPSNNYSANYNPEKYLNNTVKSTPANNYGVSQEKYNIASNYKPVSDMTKALEGAAPGVQVTNGSGAPGSGAGIQIRGRGSLSDTIQPLIVVDGAPYIGDLTSINPAEVASMNILKDANATALYGAKGANGVIVITTKHAAEKATQKKKKWSIKNWFKKSKPAAVVIPQSAIPTVAEPPAPSIAETNTDEDYDSFIENPFENPSQTPLSTFSIDVDKAAYSNVRRFINNGQHVPKDAVRVEEMINYFHYQYPQPANGNPFSINTEYSDAPWNAKHQLLKIGLQGKIISPADLPASNLVFLIDVSGSMSDANKLPLLKSSFKMLVAQLLKEDRVAIVVYAGNAGLVLPSTSGADKQTILDALDKLNAGGSTAGGEGIQLAYKIARENFIKNGNNRVILATDGDFNVGPSSDGDMQSLIEQERKSHIFLTCLGYGMGNYKDSKMETLADKGNGNYAYIDNMQEADKFLVKEFSGTMYSIAKDVKIQIEFNPQYVQAYRLIGYENRKLKPEDFANDAIDAGELGSGHTVTALYEIIPQGVTSEFSKALPGLKYSSANTSSKTFDNELATIKFRYKKPDEEVSKEMVQVIDHKPTALSNASSDFKFATSVAWFGLKLRDSKLIANKNKDTIIALARQGVDHDNEGYKAEFVRLVEAAQ